MVMMRMGEWENGRMGEWEEWGWVMVFRRMVFFLRMGRMGEWENGRMGEWKNGRMGEWEDFKYLFLLITYYSLLLT